METFTLSRKAPRRPGLRSEFGYGEAQGSHGKRARFRIRTLEVPSGLGRSFVLAAPRFAWRDTRWHPRGVQRADAEAVRLRTRTRAASDTAARSPPIQSRQFDVHQLHTSADAGPLSGAELSVGRGG